MNYSFPSIPSFTSFFSSPLLELRKKTKRKLAQTLFTQNDKLSKLATQLIIGIEKEKINASNKSIFLKKLKAYFFNDTELVKSERLAHKIAKIQKRNLEGVDITKETTSALSLLIHSPPRGEFVSNTIKGQCVQLTILDTHTYFKTSKGIYIVDALLGKGGGKTAHLVFNATKGKYAVHLKLKPLTDAKRLRHAQCEEQAYLTLKGIPQTIKCKEVVQFDGTSSFIVEYANIGSLGSRLAKLTETEQKDIALDMLKGLAQMHARNLIHRDIKPENILLTKKMKKGGQERVTAKIADYDLCVPPPTTPLSSEVRNILCGTKGFMAPELNAGIYPNMPIDLRKASISNATTPAVDIYSMGMTLYYLFGGKSLARKGKKRNLMKERAFVRQKLEDPATSVRFAPFILSMIANDPSHRPTAEQALKTFKNLTKNSCNNKHKNVYCPSNAFLGEYQWYA